VAILNGTSYSGCQSACIKEHTCENSNKLKPEHYSDCKMLLSCKCVPSSKWIC